MHEWCVEQSCALGSSALQACRVTGDYDLSNHDCSKMCLSSGRGQTEEVSSNQSASQYRRQRLSRELHLYSFQLIT